MAALVAGILFVLLVVLGLRWLADTGVENVKRLLIVLAALLFFALAASLIFTGRPVPALPALIAAVALYRRYRRARWFWEDASQWFQQQRRSSASNNMTRLEALEVLGLGESASDEEIIKAHRQLIKKLHPDQGGSDYLARQLNQARDVLLK